MMAKSEKGDEAKMEEDARIGRSSEVMGLERNGWHVDKRNGVLREKLSGMIFFLGYKVWSSVAIEKMLVIITCHHIVVECEWKTMMINCWILKYNKIRGIFLYYIYKINFPSK